VKKIFLAILLFLMIGGACLLLWQRQKTLSAPMLVPTEPAWVDKLEESLKLRLFEFKEIKIISSRQTAVLMKDGSLVIFSSHKNLENQLDSLQLILRRSKIKDKSIVRIDLRFDKPVIVYD